MPKPRHPRVRLAGRRARSSPHRRDTTRRPLFRRSRCHRRPAQIVWLPGPYGLFRGGRNEEELLVFAAITLACVTSPHVYGEARAFAGRVSSCPAEAATGAGAAGLLPAGSEHLVRPGVGAGLCRVDARAERDRLRYGGGHPVGPGAEPAKSSPARELHDGPREHPPDRRHELVERAQIDRSRASAERTREPQTPRGRMKPPRAREPAHPHRHGWPGRRSWRGPKRPTASSEA